MAVCRVYLSTYRRNTLLPRALGSLLQQTFRDWVCELHNDDPHDPFPSEHAAARGDPRITVVNHARNYGPVGSFNLFFKRIEEPFFSLLEDDNWWEPEFLETMVAAMRKHPEVQVAWSNMRVWEEQGDGSWRDTGSTLWNAEEGDSKLFQWPQPRQLSGALHSNGSMLARGDYDYPPVPPDIDFAAIEPFRERTFRHPLLLVSRPLANFSITRTSARGERQAEWTHAVTALTGTYLATVPQSDDGLRSVWREARNGARSTHTLFLAAAHFAECRRLLRFASLSDWLWTAAYSVRHPRLTMRVLSLLKAKQTQSDFLLRYTRELQQRTYRLSPS